MNTTNNYPNQKTINNLPFELAEQVASHLTNKKILDYSLLGGNFGEIIYLYQISEYDIKYREIANRMINKMFDDMHKTPLISSYCNGLAGLGIGLMYLNNNNYVEDIENILKQIDTALSKQIIIELFNDNLDFLHGYIGIGLYFLLRKNSQPELTKIVTSQIVDKLYNTAVIKDNSTKWILRQTDNRFQSNISMSHGQASSLIFLTRASSLYGNEDTACKIHELVIGSKNYIIKQIIEPTEYNSFFPTYPKDCGTIVPSRLAWCYGDLGISIALINAAIYLKDKSLRDLSYNILKYAALYRQNPQKNGVQDGSLCHGAAGIAQIFKTGYSKSNDITFKQASEYWTQILYNICVVDNNIHTFKFYQPHTKTYGINYNIIDGISGIGSFLINNNLFLEKTLLLDF